VKKNYGHLNNNNHPPTSNSSKLNRVRSITSSTNNTTLPGQRHGMPIVSTWDIPPPIPRNQQQQQKPERPTWDHYTNCKYLPSCSPDKQPYKERMNAQAS
jgi:hypothetical protein